MKYVPVACAAAWFPLYLALAYGDSRTAMGMLLFVILPPVLIAYELGKSVQAKDDAIRQERGY